MSARSSPVKQPVVLTGTGGRLRRLAAVCSPFATARSRRDWTVDLVISALALAEVVLAATGLSYLFDRLPGWWLPVDLGAGVFAVVALWWRRRYPLSIGFLLAPIGGLVISAGVSAVVAVYTVAARRRLSACVAVATAHMVVAVPYYFLVPLTDQFLLWAVSMVLIYGTAVAFGLAAKARRQVIDGLITSAERERAGYEQQLQLVRQSERQQIAREMHDVLAHRISLLSVHAGALEFRTRATGQGCTLTDDEVRSGVAVIRESAHQALEELKHVLAVLNTDGEYRGELSTDRPQATLADVSALISDARAAGQVVTYRQLVDTDQLAHIDAQLQRTIFRTIQEGLTNARKHTPGAHVDVAISGTAGSEVHLVISNTLSVGTTSAEIPGTGMGLTGLSERVRLDGGQLSSQVVDGAFVLTARLPWRS